MRAAITSASAIVLFPRNPGDAIVFATTMGAVREVLPKLLHSEGETLGSVFYAALIGAAPSLALSAFFEMYPDIMVALEGTAQHLIVEALKQAGNSMAVAGKEILAQRKEFVGNVLHLASAGNARDTMGYS